MIVVTGAAGFIGSCILKRLNDIGYEDIIVVDNIGKTDKWKNVCGKKYLDYIHKNAFISWLNTSDEAKCVDIIIHMGACSATTEQDFDYLSDNNYKYTRMLWQWCANNHKRFIYASSAATYGDGRKGFSDKLETINDLLPLNGYGYSKQLFDTWSLRQEVKPRQYVGLKYFNVYGPNEYHKDSMASVIFHSFRQIQSEGKIKLFKSYRQDYKHGEQNRDFIYVKDIMDVIEFLINHGEVNGVFNIGTGKARSFNDLANSIFSALGLIPQIDYVEMPHGLINKYQYYTEAEITKIRSAGYAKEFTSLEDGCFDYVVNYLMKDFRYL